MEAGKEAFKLTNLQVSPLYVSQVTPIHHSRLVNPLPIGLSAAVCVSTLMMQRKVANRMDAWQVDGDSPLGEPLTTHPVTFDSCDESDTESIRRFPDSHFIDHANSSYAGSVCESVRSFGDHRRSLSTQSSVNGFKNSPKLCIHKTIGTDPVDDFDADTEKNEMVDRGCSPLPLECFDSDIDSEERYGLACDLWHFRPTILPGSETEIVKEKDLFQKSEERTWLKQLETARKDPWKKNKFKMDDVCPSERVNVKTVF